MDNQVINKQNQELLTDFENRHNKKFICKRPFELVEMDMFGNIYFCFPKCNDKSYIVGNLYKSSYEDICKSEEALIFKKDILDSKYSFCDFKNCFGPNINFNIDNPDESKLLSTIYPKELRLHIDNICDVKCFMCRNNYIVSYGNEKEFKEIIIPRVISMSRDAEIIFMNGNGEVFFSPLAKELIIALTNKYPNLKFDFCTNGLKFTPEKIKEYNLVNRIKSLSVSVHSISEKTYNKIVIGGNFKKVMENLEYAKKLLNNREIENITLNFVVTKYNYKEIPAFQMFADNNDYTTFYSALNNSNNIKDYENIAIKNPNQKEFKELIKILNNPLLANSKVILDNHLLQIKNKTVINNNIFKSLMNKIIIR